MTVISKERMKQVALLSSVIYWLDSHEMTASIIEMLPKGTIERVQTFLSEDEQAFLVSLDNERHEFKKAYVDAILSIVGES